MELLPEPRMPVAEPRTEWKLATVLLFPYPSETERAIARFRRLRRLGDNHDGEGAAAADVQSVDEAVAFLGRASQIQKCLPTLSEDGKAVIEVHDRTKGFFADITFMGPEHGEIIRCYARRKNQPSTAVEGGLSDPGVRQFIEDAISVFYD